MAKIVFNRKDLAPAPMPEKVVALDVLSSPTQLPVKVHDTMEVVRLMEKLSLERRNMGLSVIDWQKRLCDEVEVFMNATGQTFDPKDLENVVCTYLYQNNVYVYKPSKMQLLVKNFNSIFANSFFKIGSSIKKFFREIKFHHIPAIATLGAIIALIFIKIFV